MSDINHTEVDTLIIELAPVQREALDQMVDLTGVDDENLAQLMFDHGFEAMSDMARLIER